MVNAMLRWLRVPSEPTPPEGSSDSVIVFRAGRNYWRWRLVSWATAQLGVFILIGFFATALFVVRLKARPLFIVLGQAAAIAAILTYLVLLPVTYQLQWLNYELRWYIVTDRSFRIRSGIWNVEEVTIDVCEYSGSSDYGWPFAGGWLGLADLVVSSAGGGVAKGEGPHAKSGHSGKFAGIENATATRDLMVERLRRYRDAGLGDRTEKPVIGLEVAAAELLAAAKELRSAVDLGVEG